MNSRNFSKDWIYFVDASDGNNLYRMKYDGSDKQLIIDEYVIACVVSECSIFYSDLSGLYRITIDGKDKTKLLSNSGYPMIVDDWVYYALPGQFLLLLKVIYGYVIKSLLNLESILRDYNCGYKLVRSASTKN